jgi:glycosyltransferase (activator-dependent family)
VRVVFVTFPFAPHFQTTVATAWALRTAGHEVHVASAPELTGAITGAGLTAVPVGSAETLAEKTARAEAEGAGLEVADWWKRIGSPPIDLAEDREDRLTWDYLTFLYGALHVPKAKIMNDALFDDLVAYCRWWEPDLVVWEALTYAGPVAAAASGAAHARMPFTIDVYHRMRQSYLRAKALRPPEDREDALAEWLDGWAGKYGVPFSEELITGNFTIDHMPDSMRLASDVPNVPIRHVHYNGPDVVPRWLVGDPPAPRVLMTFGVMSEDEPTMRIISGAQLREILDSVAGLDIELVAVLSARIAGELGDVPANTKIVQSVPLDVVIPTCSAVLNNGGIPAFCGSLTNGVPQLQISASPDAALRGEHLTRASAGLWIRPEEVTGPKVRDALVRLLEEPAFRAGAGRLQAEMAARPSLHAAVPELERLTAAHRPTGACPA